MGYFVCRQGWKMINVSGSCFELFFGGLGCGVLVCFLLCRPIY